MGQKNITLLLINILITIVIAYIVMPVVSRFFSRYLTTYAYMFLVVILVFLIIFYKRDKSFNQSFFLILPFISFKIIVFLLTRPNALIWGYGTLIEILPVLLGHFILYRLDDKSTRFFAVFTIIVLVVTIVTTYIGLQFYPNASRELAVGAGIGEEKLATYDWANIGGFEFVYSLIPIYTAIIYIFKRNNYPFFLLLLVSLFFGLFIMTAGYTIAVMMFFLSTILIFFRRDAKPRTILFIFLILIVFIVLFFDVFSNMLNSLADIVKNRYLAERLRIIANGYEGLSTSEDNRWELYLLSLTSFFKHPFFGVAFGAKSGEHSFILDNIAKYGVVGLILIVFMYMVIYKTFYKPYKNTPGFGFLYWLYIQTILIAVLNTKMLLNAFCLFVPLLLTLTKKKEKNLNENSLDRKLGA